MAATLKDIARETNLSIATVSKYINGATLREENRIAIEKAIEKLGYTVNEFARGLKSNKSRTVGVLMSDLNNPMSARLVTIVEGYLRGEKYSTLLCDSRLDNKVEAEAVRFFLEKRVDGIIAMPHCLDGRTLKPALEAGIPIVCLVQPIPRLAGQIDCIYVNNESATQRAVQTLVDAGHTRIALLNAGASAFFSCAQRIAGYERALQENGLPIDPALQITSDFTIEGAYNAARSFLLDAKDVTALLPTTYETTLGALLAIKELGLRIPEDLSFIGFSHVDLSCVSTPHLHMTMQPLEEMGTHAAKLLLERMKNSGGSKMSITVDALARSGASVQHI